MKQWLTVILVIYCLSLPGLTDSVWQEYQKEIGIQAGQYKNSSLHLEQRLQPTRSYQVGDTDTFWRWNLSVMPPLWIQTAATCRAVGEHSYIFVADSEWNVHMTQANVDTILVRLEQNTPNNPNQGAIMMDVELFGAIPDELDNDPKLIVFYSALGSFQGSTFDGYFSAYNQVTEAEAQQMNPSGHSNECEMIYMTCYPLNPVAPIRMSVLAHELEHLIHWGQDPNEQTWIDEGCAELAMVAYGIPDPISGFNSNPDNDLTAWNQTTADYVKVMLFFTYLQEHHDETGLIRDLVADPANGIASLEYQFNLHYPQLSLGELLRNWNVANAIDQPQIADGLYNYSALTLPTFTSTSLTQYPNNTNQSISAYAADYLTRVLPQEGFGVSFQVSSPVYITAIVFDEAGLCTAVIDGGIVDQLQLTSFPVGTYKVVFVISNTNSNAVTYSYTSGTVANDDNIALVSRAELECYPNPFRWDEAGMQIKVNNSKSTATKAKMEIYNLKGQLIQTILLHPGQGANALEANWNGKNSQNKTVANGIYLMRYSDGTESLTKRISLVR